MESPPMKVRGGFLLVRGPENRKVGLGIWLKEQ
jgi:hypothetical protein